MQHIRKVINKINITMKAILICFLCFLCLVNAEVVVIDSTCDSFECDYHLTDYVKKVNPKTINKYNNFDFMATISHTKPNWDVAGLYARAFTTTYGEIEITDFTRTDDASNIYLHIRFNHTQDIINCEQLPTNNGNFYQECSILIKYYNTARSLVKIYTFSFVIRRRWDGFFFLSTVPERNGCNYILDLSLRFKTKIYREDCRDELSYGSSLSHGEFICFGIFGDDDISKSFEHELASLRAIHSRPGEDDKITIVEHSSWNMPGKGQMYIMIRITDIGRFKFSILIALRDEYGRLKSESGLVALPGVFEMYDLYGRFIND